MGKDKRCVIIAKVHDNSGSCAIYKKYVKFGKDQIEKLFDLTLTMEEIMLKLDVMGIKWKRFEIEDNRQYRGRVMKKSFFYGDTMSIEMSDRNDPALYQRKLDQANRLIRPRADSMQSFDWRGMPYGSKVIMSGTSAVKKVDARGTCGYAGL